MFSDGNCEVMKRHTYGVTIIIQLQCVSWELYLKAPWCMYSNVLNAH
jgi:hypothetical protein